MPKNFVIDASGSIEKRDGFKQERANYGDEILATAIFCGCPVREVTKHLANGASHPDLLVVHEPECRAYEAIKAKLKK